MMRMAGVGSRELGCSHESHRLLHLGTSESNRPMGILELRLPEAGGLYHVELQVC